MQKQIISIILSATFLSIILIGGSVLFVVRDNQVAESERAISVAQEHLRKKLRLFDLMIAEDEGVLEKRIKMSLPKIAGQLLSQHNKLDEVSVEFINRLCVQYEVDEIYVINREGIVINTNFSPDMNLNLKGVSEAMAELLDSLYGKGIVVSDRFNISVATGVIKKYSYYSPPESNYIFEIAHHLKPHLAKVRSKHYVDFLFGELFLFDSASNTEITSVDILIPHDIGVWSLLKRNKKISMEVVGILSEFTESEVRVESDEKINIYKKFNRINTGVGQSPYFITHIEYDTQYHHDVLVKSSFILFIIVIIITISSFLVVSFYIDRNIFVHINNIVNHLNALANGSRSVLNIQNPLEFKLISQAVNYMQDKILSRENDLKKANDDFEIALIERTTELRNANEKLEHLSFHDGLTGLANRRRFDVALPDELHRLRRSSGCLSFFIIDIDYFKNYNDTLGHVPGDDCLRKISSFLDSIVRRAPDLAARYGGEEFSVILPDIDGTSAEKIANNICEGVYKLAIAHPSSEVGPYVSVSIGAITLKIDAEYSPKDIIDKADKLLYKAKKEGRNRVVFKDFTL